MLISLALPMTLRLWLLLHAISCILAVTCHRGIPFILNIKKMLSGWRPTALSAWERQNKGLLIIETLGQADIV
jgi:hypothetical protein